MSNGYNRVLSMVRRPLSVGDKRLAKVSINVFSVPMTRTTYSGQQAYLSFTRYRILRFRSAGYFLRVRYGESNEMDRSKSYL
jgi:hypothetical protein